MSKRPMLHCTSYAMVNGEYKPVLTTWADGRIEWHMSDEERITIMQEIFDHAAERYAAHIGATIIKER